MAAIKNFSLFIILIVLLAVFGAIYTVNEGQKAFVMRLGEIIKDPATGQGRVINPGLHFKLPFINSVRYFDVRLRTMDVQSSRILTDQQKYVLVDYYTKWRISDLPLYFQRTGGFGLRAENLLAQKINNALRAAFGQLSMSEVISGQRLNVMLILKQKADESAQGLGIDVIDVRIKRIDLPREVSESVFARMRTERQQVATKHRSDGHAAANAMRAEADAKATVLLANAKRDAAQIRAKGVTRAAKIYTDSYQKDTEFYAFLRSLDAYQNSFTGKSDLIVLQPEGEFFKYFKRFKKKVNGHS